LFTNPKKSIFVRLYKNIIYLLVFFYHIAVAQNEYNVWVFGNKAGLDFNYNPPKPITIPKFFTVESSSSICNKKGELLFYTNGDTIFNKEYKPMLDLKPGFSYQNIASSRQGSFIIKKPRSFDQYYLISGPSFQSTDTMMSYWQVDMKGDNGKGAIIEKAISLKFSATESFGVTQHSNGKDFWVAAINKSMHFFNCTRTVNGIFSGTVNTQKLQRLKYAEFHLNNKFSPNSKIFTGQITLQHVNNIREMFFDIYKFNNFNGLLSERILIPLPHLSNIESLEFSPNSRFLYLTEEDFSANPKLQKIVQYDLSIWDSISIINSKTVVFSFAIEQFNYKRIRGMQLGPDGKIYVFNSHDSFHSIIENPNLKGLDCEFKFRNKKLENLTNVHEGSPYYPTFEILPIGKYLGNDTVLCNGDSITLFSGADSTDNILWSNGETSPNISVSKEGKYHVFINHYSSDTIQIKIANKFRVYLGSDTAFCGNFSHLLSAGSGAKAYNWNTGEILESITINKQGQYSVTIKDSLNCPAGDTIQINQLLLPKVNITYDSINCYYAALSIEKVDGIKYLWNTGDTSSNILVTQKGTYSLRLRNKFCELNTNIQVDFLAKPEIDLGPDRDLCEGSIVLTSKDPGKHFWSTEDTTNSIIIKKAGTYSLIITRNSCSTSDSVRISDCPDVKYYIPDAITPNGDLLNDVFRIVGENINNIHLEIFNRWGEKIHISNGIEANWDGTYKNNLCPDGIYFYTIQIEGYLDGTSKKLFHKGTLTLIR
jgi:gliding motility-associated-like protein